MHTFLVAIGVGEYEEGELFSRLEGAGSDARKFRRFFDSKGVPRDNIRLLIDSEATTKNILKALRVWRPRQERLEPKRLIVYFAGHGVSVTDGARAEESVLITYDTEFSDPIQTGISLGRLVDSMAKFGPSELYLFVDACSQSFRGLDVFDSLLPASVVCVLGAGEKPALEDKNRKRGVFTDILLNRLEDIEKQENPKSSDLVSCVLDDCNANSFPTPEVYLLRDQNNWLLKGVEAEIPDETLPKNVIRRLQVEQALWSKINDSFPMPLVVFGKSGSGKTTTCYSISENYSDCTYISWNTNFSSVCAFEEALISLVSELEPHISGKNDSSLSEDFWERISTKLSGLVILIDHVEKIEQRREFLSLVNRFGALGIQAVLIVRGEINSFPQFSSFLVPNFSSEEAKALLKNISDVNESGLTLFNDATPLEILSGFTSLIPNRSATAIVHSEGFINIDLFIKKFNLDQAELEQLIIKGVVTNTNGVFLPHDSILSSAKREPGILNDCLDYWATELIDNSKSEYSARKLVYFCGLSKKYSYEVDRALSLAIWFLNENDELTLLKEAEYILRENIEKLPKSAMTFCRLRIEQGHPDQSLILQIRRLKNIDQLELQLLEARYGWWNGDFEKTIKCADLALGISPSKEYISEALLEKGIAYFFLGAWEDALNWLEKANNKTTASSRTIAWAKAIIGTIIGLRGVDVNKGTDYLYSAIRLMEQMKDIYGLAVAYGNLGEIQWKSGDFASSSLTLKRGLKFARKGRNHVNEIESMRNMLHVNMRVYGPHSDELRKSLDELLGKDVESQGTMEKMQVANSLTTVFAHQNDIVNAKKWLSIAEELTEGNLEYTIYTLGNKSLMNLISGDFEEASKFIFEALELAEKGGNYLAIKQLIDDFKCIVDCYCLESVEQVQKTLERIGGVSGS